MNAPRSQAAPNPPPPSARPRPEIVGRLNKFWRRVTEGLELGQLWRQFSTEARASYRLYQKDFDARVPQGTRKQDFFHTAQEFAWALLEKLTPARRVLLLLGIVLLLFPATSFNYEGKSGHLQVVEFDLHFLGGLVLLLLLLLEVADRVVMKRDLEIARDIQRWLLPAEAPQVPGLDIAFATRPANTVAGDYYDVFARPGADPEGARYLLAVADVVGKSIPAALLMATFQASLKTLSTTPCTLPDLVAGMNRYACTNSQSGLRFTTAFLGEFDSLGRGLTYINAGHNHPIVLRTSGAVERLSTGGLPLGILAAAAYQAGSITLEPGDWLVVFTDGLVEAMNAQGEEYGEQRLLEVLRSDLNTTPKQMMQRIMNFLDAFVAATPQHDDVTCLLVRALNA
jgi:serine phosphatase RsbU (regulator of sigma subunit)